METVRKVLKSIVNFSLTCGTKLNRRFPLELLNAICDGSSKIVGEYVNYEFLPVDSSQVYNLKIESAQVPSTAIIMQGPILKKDNFTIETIKIYKKLMPQAKIILSTWKDTSPEIINEIKQLDVDIVLSDYPKKSGVGNINYQVTTTNAGILCAEKAGAQYVFKTRTDQRFNRPYLLEYLHSLTNNYPVGDGFAYLNQKCRLVFSQGTTFSTMFVPYFLGDFYLFGEISDVKKYFDFELKNDKYSSYSNMDRKELSDHLKKMSDGTLWEVLTAL